MLNNLKLEFGDKSLDYIGGSPYRTRIVLKNDDGAYYPIFFPPEDIEKDNATLYQMAMDVVYQKNSNGRAEDERFNTMGGKIAQVDDALERAQKQYEQVETMIKTTTSMVNELIATMLGGEENEETI